MNANLDMSNGSCFILGSFLFKSQLIPVWPSSISRDSNCDMTNLHLYTGKDWVGRFEEDVCTIIGQVAGDVG